MLVEFLIELFLYLTKYVFIEPPVVSTDKSHVLVSPGGNVDLKCNVIGQTYPDIRWFKGSELVRFCI